MTPQRSGFLAGKCLYELCAGHPRLIDANSQDFVLVLANLLDYITQLVALQPLTTNASLSIGLRVFPQL